MQLWRQIASGYLALCLALAGLMGISPDLHRLLEHGGHGAAHSHRGLSAFEQDYHPHGEDHSHPQPHPHLHEANPENGGEPHGRIFVSNHRSFSLPLEKVWLAAVRWVDQWATNMDDAPASSPSGEEPGHEHHSLAQLLANGLLEQALDMPVLAVHLSLGPPVLPTPKLLVLPALFEAQTAGRAPPCLWS